MPHCIQYFGDRAGYIKKADPSLHKSFNGDFVRRIQDGRRAAARPQRIARQPQRRKRTVSGAMKSSRASVARSNRGDGVVMRSGHASVCEIGIRMSGEPSCARTLPSR